MQSLRASLTRPVDRRTLMLVFSILAFNLVDAFATLRHLSHGAEELNPFMLAALHRGATAFVLVKHALASIGVLGIVAHRDLPIARIALLVLCPLYCAIAAYQIALFAFIH